MLVFAFVVTGTTMRAGHQAAGQKDKEPAAKKPVKPVAKPEKDTEAEDSTAWGKEVGGLQAGLSISNRSDIQIGGKVAAVVKLRNASKETITASARPFWVSGPRVVDSSGKPVRATSPPQPLFEIIPTKLTLKPSQTVVVAKSHIFVVDAEAKDQPFPEGVVDQFTIHVRPGTYRRRFRRFRARASDPGDGNRGFRGDGHGEGGVSPPGARRSAACKRAWASARREAGLQPRRDGHAGRPGSQRRQGGGQVPVPPPVLRREPARRDGWRRASRSPSPVVTAFGLVTSRCK